MDGTEEYCSKQSNLGPERETLHALSYVDSSF